MYRGASKIAVKRIVIHFDAADWEELLDEPLSCLPRSGETFLTSYLVDEVSLQSPVSCYSKSRGQTLKSAHHNFHRADIRSRRRLRDIVCESPGTWYLVMIRPECCREGSL